VVKVMRYIEGRIKGLADVWDDLGKPPAKAKPQTALNGHGLGEVEAQPGDERANDLGTDGDGDLSADERRAPPPDADNPAAYLELEPLIPSGGRDRADGARAVFVSAGTAAVATDFVPTEMRPATVAQAPDLPDPASFEPEQIDIVSLIEPAVVPAAEPATLEREQVPTVSMVEAGGAQATVQIESENEGQVPTVSMLEAAMRPAPATGAPRPPEVVQVLNPAAHAGVASFMETETMREVVAAIDAEAEDLLHDAENGQSQKRGATLLVLPIAGGPGATARAGKPAAEVVASEQAENPDDVEGLPVLELAPAAEASPPVTATGPEQGSPAASALIDLKELASGRALAPAVLVEPAVEAEAHASPSPPTDGGPVIAAPGGAGVKEPVTTPVTTEAATAETAQEPTGSAAPRIQLRPGAPRASAASVPGPKSIRGPADASDSDLAELLFEPEREPVAPASAPNPLPVIQFTNDAGRDTSGSLAQASPKADVFAPVASPKAEQAGANGAAAPKGIRSDVFSAPAATSSPTPPGPTAQNPQRPAARPAANDPLAAILALSEEEKIALFS
jgi:hypothetical protein